MIRYLRVAIYALLIMSLGVGVTGCMEEGKRRKPPKELGEDVGTPGEDAGVQTDADPPRKDSGTPDVDPDTGDETDVETDAETDVVEIAEAPPQAGHQLCAVAGKSSNGDVIAVHCLGTHDASGFQAKNEHGIWQPGTLQIIAK